MAGIDLINAGSIITTMIGGIIGALLYMKQGVLERKDEELSALKAEMRKNEELITHLTRKHSKLEEFCKTVVTTEKEATNIIVIGPRDSGKSSIVTLWCKLERLISSIEPTVNFETYDFSREKVRVGSFFDNEIGLERVKHFKSYFKIYDYAGEDSQVKNATEAIASSPNCTIVMVFNSDPGYVNDNRRYFSRSFVDKVNEKFNQKSFKMSSVKKVYIVFNKVDLVSVSSNYDVKLSDLKKIFSDSVINIEAIFGVEVSYFVTSAKSNHNVINLLQNIVKSYE